MIDERWIGVIVVGFEICVDEEIFEFGFVGAILFELFGVGFEDVVN